MAKTALVQFALDAVLWVPTYRPVYKSADGLVAFSHRLTMVERAIAPYPRFVASSVETIDDFALIDLDMVNLIDVVEPEKKPDQIVSGVPWKMTSEAAPVHSPPQPDRTYAVNTFAALSAQYPQTDWYWLIGVDAFQSLPRWYHHQKLAPYCHWLVAPRLRTEMPPTEWTSLEPPHASRITSSHQVCQQICEHVAETLANEKISLRWSLLDMPFVNISSSRVRHDFREGRSIEHLVPPAVQAYLLEQGLYFNPL